jgi:integrase
VTLYFRRLTTRLGMPEIRLHDLRHFAATTALKSGEPDVVVSGMLGHSKTQTTKDLYFDFIPTDATGATDAIGKAIEWDR